MRHLTLIILVVLSACAEPAKAQPLTLNDAAFVASVMPATNLSAPSLPTNDIFLWLRADAGVVADGGGSISVWHDQSGHGYDAVPAGDVAPHWSASALSGKPAVVFDNSTNLGWLNITGLTLDGDQWTVVTVSLKRSADDNDATAYSRVVSFTSPGQNDYDTPNNWNAQFYTEEDFGQPDGTNALVTLRNSTAMVALDAAYDHWNIATSILDGADDISGLDIYPAPMTSASDSEGDALSSSEIILGNSYDTTASDSAFNGSLAEVMIWNRILTDTELAAIQNYLATKYGL